MAIREFLSFQLDFNEEELNRLDIQETKEGREDITYFAAGNLEMLKEIHYRKADSRNDRIMVRNYVPPSFYKRYMAVSEHCKVVRNRENDIKTQMRFGDKDVEVYVKQKGGKEGYKQVDLNEFMEGEYLPQFEHKLSWKKQETRPVRRKLNYRRETDIPPSGQKPNENPAERKETSGKTTLTRQHSTETEEVEKRKKRKTENEKEQEDEQRTGREGVEDCEMEDEESQNNHDESI